MRHTGRRLHGEAVDTGAPTLAVTPELLGARVTGHGPGLVPAVVTTPETSPVALDRFATGAVAVEGPVRVAAELTARLEEWTPRPTGLTYQWAVGGAPVGRRDRHA